MPPRPRRVCEDEISQRWAALSVERRQAVMSFDDVVLVECIKSSLQALFEKQMMMNATMSTLGIPLRESNDPFANSKLFTQVFEFTWPMSRSQRNPQMVMMEAGSLPIMQMKSGFAAQPNVFEEFRSWLPDMFSEKRNPMAKARWKELWNQEPFSVSAMERQIVKLAEQAFWAMGADPAFAVPDTSVSKGRLLADAMEGDDVPFEAWMVDACPPTPKSTGSGDSKKLSNRKKKKQFGGAPATSTLTPGPAPVLDADDDDDEDEEEEAARKQKDADSQAHDDEDSHQASSEPLCSDDEIVHGVFDVDHAHAAAGISTLSTQQTAASTPACSSACGLKGLPQLPHKPPPTSMQPRQLVCYIWNQTSQFPNHSASDSRFSSLSDGFSRGAWLDPSQPVTPSSFVAKAVVKNSFIDIEDPSEPRMSTPSRTSRSLSPSYLHSREESWHDHWHV